ncbi:MAG: DUF4040 domain-containing protein [Ardenticatenaceae bacterium]|nr:DUF4040 domain-containing protein [Ardenticatenaceae bacterium]
MEDTILWFPILLILAGAALAGLYGLPALNRRLTLTQASALLALFPAGALAFVLQRIWLIRDDSVLTWRISWIPSLGLELGLYYDSLAALFAFLVTGIGTLIILYTGQYFKDDNSAWRFLAYLLLFMGSMLGLVMAGDVLTLFIFWEGTSITSFLLVAYKYKDEAARRGAFRALFITGGGGIALLAGLLMVSYVAGSTQWGDILGQGALLRGSALYPVMLGLIALGAFTKSAQFPAHIWLPGAMSAPTPASAYLHSATMVKAGIYLLARMNPALGQTEGWFWLLSLVGLVTMVAGAYLGLKQNDLKALLAYSTISQLGVLVMLIGQDTSIAFKALVIGVLAHALYKSALFLVAGIVDHEVGTRDLRRLGGLRRAMPYTFAVAVIAGLSMAGLPPMLGFLAKETLLASAVHESVPPLFSQIFAAATVFTGAFMLAQSGLMVMDTFTGRARGPYVRVHEAPWLMWLAPAIPAVLSLLIGLSPEPQRLAEFLAHAATNAYGGEKVKVSLALWNGLNVPLLLSVVAISLGFVVYFYRARVRAWQATLGAGLTFNALYDGVLAGLDHAAAWVLRLQAGRLRRYLVVILGGMFLLMGIFGGYVLPSQWASTTPTLSVDGVLGVLQLFALLVAVGAGLASVLLRRDLYAILALGAMGLSVALLMVLKPAPDVALVQIVVDILSTVVLVLALTRLPVAQRRRAQGLTFRQSPAGLWRDGLVAAGSGIVVAMLTLATLLYRARTTVVTPYYEANAKPLTGAADIVGAIIVDFRALDTLFEIGVFAAAGLGVYTLLRYAARLHGDSGRQVTELPLPAGPRTLGISGAQTSSFLRALAYVVLPLALSIAAVHMMYGHDRPGDGFTAGVIISLAVGFWFVVFGYAQVRQRLRWWRGGPLLGVGMLLAIVNGVGGLLFHGSFLAEVNYGEMLGLRLPAGFAITNGFIFEVAICLTVLGSMAFILNTLGHPGDRDVESEARVAEIGQTAGQVADDYAGNGVAQGVGPRPGMPQREGDLWKS